MQLILVALSGQWLHFTVQLAEQQSGPTFVYASSATGSGLVLMGSFTACIYNPLRPLDGAWGFQCG